MLSRKKPQNWQEGMIQELNIVESFESRSVFGNLFLASFYWGRKEIGKALQYFKANLPVDPHNDDTKYTIVQLLRRENRIKEAFSFLYQTKPSFRKYFDYAALGIIASKVGIYFILLITGYATLHIIFPFNILILLGLVILTTGFFVIKDPIGIELLIPITAGNFVAVLWTILDWILRR